jgi:hypothetical protein
MNLESVGKLVARHIASPEETQRRLDKAERDREIVRRMFNWITFGLIVMGLGCVMLVVNKTFDIGKIFKLFSTLTTLGGVSIAMGGLMSGMKRGAELPSRRTQRELADPTREKSIPTNSFPEALPSVTERTTKLIESAELPKKISSDLQLKS